MWTRASSASNQPRAHHTRLRSARRLDQGGATRIDTASSAKSSLESSSHHTRQGTRSKLSSLLRRRWRRRGRKSSNFLPTHPHYSPRPPIWPYETPQCRRLAPSFSVPAFASLTPVVFGVFKLVSITAVGEREGRRRRRFFDCL